MNKSASVRLLSVASAILLTLFISGCGGGGSTGSSVPNTPPPIADNPVAAAQIRSASLITTINASAIRAVLPAALSGTVVPLYDVDAWKLTYTTLDAAGHITTASGLVAVPRKGANASSPVLSYQHATAKTDAEAPSNHATADEPAILFASLGFVVNATDYVGYGASKGQPHPYLLAAPTASAVIDLNNVSTTWRSSRNIADNGQLFLTGYSEGAYASIATLRRMTQNRNGALPVATFVGAGPYSVTRTLSDLTDAARARNVLLGALISPGLLKHLGANDRAKVRNLLLETALGDNTDVVWDGRFLDNYLADDNNAIEAESNVHNWTPQSPIIFFHGRDDTTVSYANTDLAIAAMQARGAGAQLERIDCPARPSSHLGCVAPFLLSDIARLRTLARNL
jgi:hypothetical protein